MDGAVHLLPHMGQHIVTHIVYRMFQNWTCSFWGRIVWVIFSVCWIWRTHGMASTFTWSNWSGFLANTVNEFRFATNVEFRDWNESGTHWCARRCITTDDIISNTSSVRNAVFEFVRNQGNTTQFVLLVQSVKWGKLCNDASPQLRYFQRSRKYFWATEVIYNWEKLPISGPLREKCFLCGTFCTLHILS
jgi:hypothetical protein